MHVWIHQRSQTHSYWNHCVTLRTFLSHNSDTKISFLNTPPKGYETIFPGWSPTLKFFLLCHIRHIYFIFNFVYLMSADSDVLYAGYWGVVCNIHNWENLLIDTITDTFGKGVSLESHPRVSIASGSLFRLSPSPFVEDEAHRSFRRRVGGDPLFCHEASQQNSLFPSLFSTPLRLTSFFTFILLSLLEAPCISPEGTASLVAMEPKRIARIDPISETLSIAKLLGEKIV